MKNLIQISDCHIDDDPITMGVNSRQNLQKVIHTISQKNFDTLLISGDLSHNGTLNSYKILKKILTKITCNLVIIPGNHDHLGNLAKVFADNLIDKFSLGNWEIINLNSVQVSKTSGALERAELEKLAHLLQQSSAEYNIIVLHHPIVPMESNWDDSLSLENPQALFKVIDKHPKIKAVLWGHAHQASTFHRQQIALISCPSTALQFDQQTGIGFNHYQLHNNGNLDYYTEWI